MTDQPDDRAKSGFNRRTFITGAAVMTANTSGPPVRLEKLEI
jgi:hypothetical protein